MIKKISIFNMGDYKWLSYNVQYRKYEFQNIFGIKSKSVIIGKHTNTEMVARTREASIYLP